MLRWEICVAPDLLCERLLDHVVMIIKDTQSFDETDGVGVDVLQFFPSLNYHALLVLDKDNVLENFDVLIFIILVNFAFIRDYEMRV